MKNIWSALFGARADEPAVSAPLASPEERKLDAIWSNYFRLTRTLECWQRHFLTLPPPAPYRREDFPGETSTWPALLAQHRFFLVVFPITYSLHGQDTLDWHYDKRRHFPLRSVVQNEGGFAAYCSSVVFAHVIRQTVTDWQLAALEWNRAEGHRFPHHEPEAILKPDITVHLLDPEATELVKVKLPRWPFRPPEPPAPMPAKLIPPPTQPGIGKAISHRLKVKRR